MHTLQFTIAISSEVEVVANGEDGPIYGKPTWHAAITDTRADGVGAIRARADNIVELMQEVKEEVSFLQAGIEPAAFMRDSRGKGWDL